MSSPESELMERLYTAIDAWNDEITGSYGQLAAQLAAAQSRLDTLLAEAASSLAPAEAEALREALQEREAQAAEREARLAEQGELLDRLRQENAALRMHLVEQQEAYAALEAELVTVRSQTPPEDPRMALLEQEAVEARERADHLSQSLEEAAALQRQLEQSQRELGAAQSEIEALNAALAAVRTAPPSSVPRIIDLSRISAFDAQGHKKRMGEILLELGILSSDQLQAILGEQNAHPPRRLGKIVVERGFTNDIVIAKILAAQLRLAFVELREGDIDPEAPRMISVHLANLHHCVPIRRDGEVLTLAMTNPLDLIAIEDVELATQCRVEPVVATPASIDFTIARYCADA